MRLKIQKIRCIEVRNHGEKMENLSSVLKSWKNRWKMLKDICPKISSSYATQTAPV